MIIPKLLHSYIKSDDEYNKLFEDQVKVDTDWWEESITHDAINPTEKEVQELREDFIKPHKDMLFLKNINFYYESLLITGKAKVEINLDIHKLIKEKAEKYLWEKPLIYTDEYVKDVRQRFLLFGSLLASQGVKELSERKRAKARRMLRKVARTKNKKILRAVPFDNIKCKNCKTVMLYQWSMLSNMPNDPKGEEKVLFFYVCPNKCGKQAVFEDGTPWILENNNSCAVCGGNRSTTVTKDSSGNTYIIFECNKCKSRQVEKMER